MSNLQFKMLVCTACGRDVDDIPVMKNGEGAEPKRYVQAVVSQEVVEGKMVRYVALHKPDCWRVQWAKG